VFFEKDAVQGLYFDPKGSWLAIKIGERAVRLRDLSAPDQAESRLLFRAELDTVSHVAFHPTEPWVAVVGRERVRFYPLDHPYPFVLKGTGPIGSFDIGFTPDGSSLITAFPVVAPIQLWPVPGQSTHSRRNVGEILDAIYRTAVDPLGKYVLVSGGEVPGTRLISIQDGTAQVLPEVLHGLDPYVTYSNDGKLAAAAAASGPPENLGIEIWNLENKSVRVLNQSKGKSFHSLIFSPDGSVFSGDDQGNLWQWDLKKNTATVLAIGKGIVFDLGVSRSGRYIAAAVLSIKQLGEIERATSDLILYDVSEKKSRTMTTHGNRVSSVAFDPGEKTLVTGDLDGIVRVGPITEDTPPHLLFGSETGVFDIAVHPSGKWIVSDERARASVRFWRMPSGTPFQTLPHEGFLNHLRELTNVRVVQDKNASTGYRIELAPFPGWEKTPNW
jgi:WD40 repeat protein